MATSLNLKRKNIDLPADAFQKLSLMAVAQGKSLKAYIESILISKANSINIEINENPSPSGDEWFADPKNIAIVKEGISEYNDGQKIRCDINEIKGILGV